jgi:hypothetical protein
MRMSSASPEPLPRAANMAALLAALQQRERRRQALRAELAELERVTDDAARLDLPRTLNALRERLIDWQGLLREEAPQARQALSALLAGRLIFTPHGEGPARYYEFAGARDAPQGYRGVSVPNGNGAPGGSRPI